VNYPDEASPYALVPVAGRCPNDECRLRFMIVFMGGKCAPVGLLVKKENRDQVASITAGLPRRTQTDVAPGAQMYSQLAW
jgi:hypothetical protein